MRKFLFIPVLLALQILCGEAIPLANSRYHIHSKEKGTTTRFEVVRITPNRKYRISCKVTNSNPRRGNAQGIVVALNAAGERIDSSLYQFYPWNRESHPERSFSHTFYTPPDAAALRIYFQCGQPEHILDVKELFLEQLPPPADGDLEKERLLSTWYAPLKWIEKSAYVPTPHKKWFKPASFEMPDVLYMPYIRGSYAETCVRRMQECAQRMDIDFTYHPLLGKIREIGGNRLMGIYGSIMDKGIEKYSLRGLPPNALPGCLVVQDLDFGRDGAPELLDLLERMRRADRPLVFIDCRSVPEKFLGVPSPEEMAEELKFLPVRRSVSPRDLEKFAALYRRGKGFSLTFNFRSGSSPFNPLIPEEVRKYREITRTNWVYPWYEYTELLFCRLLKKIAGAAVPGKITRVSPEEKALTLECQGAGGELEILFLDRFNDTLAVKRCASAGKIRLSADEIPRSAWNVEYRLFHNGKISDAGAAALRETPHETTTLILPESVPYGQSLSVRVATSLPCHRGEATVTQAEGRVVLRRQLGPDGTFSFTPENPADCLHLAAVKLFDRENRLIDSAKREFSVINRPVDTERMHALVWTKLHNSEKYPVYKNLGFEKIICYQTNTDGLQAIRMINGEPVVMSNCSVAWGNDWRAYKSDCPGPRIRSVCFSDDARRKKADENIDRLLKRTMARYYDTNFQLYGDEKFLGRDCCFSQWCMRDFRKAFPEARESDCLPGKKHHLDHRIFMNKVFAENFVNSMAKSHRKVFPNLFGGLSGTGNPGASYNWPMLMKRMNFVAYYSGIQRKMVFDFGGKKIIAGRWKGYTLPVRKDFYVGSWFWEDFFCGANLVPLYAANSEMSGFLAVTPPLETLSALLREVRRGMDKLFLSAEERPEIILLFNQRSVFLNTDTPQNSLWQRTLTGWDALLRDAAVPYRFVDSDAFTGNEKAKLLVVPGGSVLSDRDFAGIRRFIARGGRVCAEKTPGEYDDKSRKRPPELLKKLLEGVSVWGKSIDTYETVELGGIGGETAEVTSGDFREKQQLRLLMDEELKRSGIVPFARLESDSGARKIPALRTRYRNGVGLLGIADLRTGNSGDASEQIIAACPAEPCRLLLAEPGYVYDLRKRRFLGFGKEFPVALHPGFGGFYAVHPAMPEPFKVQIAPMFRQGDKITFTLSGKGDLMKRLFYFELTAPGGKVFSGCMTAVDGVVTGSFRSAFNDPAGRWELQVFDCASDMTRKVAFDLK